MKKALLSLLFVSALAMAGFGQTTQKRSISNKVSTTTVKTQATSKGPTVAKGSISSSAAKSNETTAVSITGNTSMTKPKHKHSTTHKLQEKTIN
jgi:hypothetical protein